MEALMFYVLATLILIGAISVLLFPNPIYSALSLAVSMVALGFMYFQLGAHFIAGVQLIVYAGAVMVLFVMVLMLFDLQREEETVNSGRVGKFLKTFCAITLAGLVAGAIRASVSTSELKGELTAVEQMENIKLLATKLFTQYVFAFEALGILLLVIAIGVVAVSRTRGGTHAPNE
jgi:NADH-quinone oxidoreductase subunit J